METRALVLGGGGVGGIAWEVGVLRGLREAGFDTEHWDLVVGTSAGAFVGARLLGRGSLDDLFAKPNAEPIFDEIALETVLGASFLRVVRLARHRRLGWIPLVWFGTAIVTTIVRYAARRGVRRALALVGTLRERDPTLDQRQAIAAAIGALAIMARTRDQRHWLDFWQGALSPVHDWPSTRFIATAVDTADGSRHGFESSADVPIWAAVAASGSLPILCPPISVEGRRYIDGGFGSIANADLARGYDRVLIVAPMDRGGLDAQIEELRVSHAVVHVIRPSTAATLALGAGIAVMDPARHDAVTRAGYTDGKDAATAARAEAL